MTDDAKPATGRQLFMNMRLQILLAARQQKDDVDENDFFSDAFVYAWKNGVYPLFSHEHDVVSEPFADCFDITKDMMEQLGQQFSDLEDKTFSFYDVLKVLGNGWTNSSLATACRYMYLNDTYPEEFWKDLLTRDHPIEAKKILSPHERVFLIA